MRKLIQVKESVRYPGLFVKKYSRHVFYDNLWNANSELLECRGHVEDANGNVVVRPFTKIFNRGENNTDINRDEMCLAIRKVNGFMAAATYVPSLGQVVVSTTGSLDSDFVTIAEKYVNKKVKDFIKRHWVETGDVATWMFEICDPSDLHIINEEFGAYLIGCRKVSDDLPYFSDTSVEVALDIVAEQMDVLRPSHFYADFETIKQVAKGCDHEGYVVYGQVSKTALKIKSPYYLVLKMCARRKDILSLNKELVDEEFYPLINHLTENRESFIMLNENERLDYMKEYLKNV